MLVLVRAKRQVCGEKEWRRRKKVMAVLTVLTWLPDKLLDGSGLFGVNVFKNPVRYICMYMW